MNAEGFAAYLKSDKSKYPALGLIALLLLLIYGKTVSYDFNIMDDLDYVLQNPHVYGGFTLDSIKWAFTPDNLESQIYYMPVSWLSLMFDGALWGTNPTGYHLTSLLLFVANSMLLYLFLAKLLGRNDLPLLAVLLFALHPMRVESVVWISQRKDLVSGLFLLASLLFYLSFRGSGKVGCLAGSLAAFVLGILSKPNIVMLPCLLVLIEYFLRAESTGSDLSRVKPVRVLFPYFLISAAAVFYTLYVSEGLRIELPLRYRFFTAAYAHFHYLYKTFLPVNLYLSESHFQIAEVVPLNAVIILAVLAGVTVAAFAIRHKARLFFFGWLWFLLSLAPVNGFIPTGNVLWSDKFTFLPHMGLALAVAGAVFRVFMYSRKAVAVAAVGVLLTLSALTFGYAGKWENTYTICMNTLENDGPQGFAYTFMAGVMAVNGNLDEALRLLDKAEEADPKYQLLYHDRAELFRKMGKLPEALRDYEKSIQLFPGDHSVLRKIAEVYEVMGDREAAGRYRSMAEGGASP